MLERAERVQKSRHYLRLCFPGFGVLWLLVGTFDSTLEDSNTRAHRHRVSCRLREQNFLDWSDLTAGHCVGARRKDQDWETARWIWLVSWKKKQKNKKPTIKQKTKSSLEISWGLNWRWYIPHGPACCENCFSNSGPKSLSFPSLLKILSLLPHILTHLAHLPYFCNGQ